MLLSIPDIRQADDYDCGSAAVAAVDTFHGARRRAPWNLSNRTDGMSPDTVAALLRAMGYRVLSGPMVAGLADLHHYTRAGLPVLCPITVDAGGHWVVVRGVGRGRVYLHDPTHGARSVRAHTWLDGWRDTSASGHPYDGWGVVAAPCVA